MHYIRLILRESKKVSQNERLNESFWIDFLFIIYMLQVRIYNSDSIETITIKLRYLVCTLFINVFIYAFEVTTMKQQKKIPFFVLNRTQIWMKIETTRKLCYMLRKITSQLERACLVQHGIAYAMLCYAMVCYGMLAQHHIHGGVYISKCLFFLHQIGTCVCVYHTQWRQRPNFLYALFFACCSITYNNYNIDYIDAYWSTRQTHMHTHKKKL